MEAGIGEAMSRPKKFGASGDHKKWLEFRVCSRACFACNACGYFWGVEHDYEQWRGKPATWSGQGNAGGVGRDPRSGT